MKHVKNYLQKFNSYDDSDKLDIVAHILSEMIKNICNENWVFEFNSIGFNIRVDGMHPCNPVIHLCLQESPQKDTLIGIVISEYSPYTFCLGMFKGSSDLDEISGCTLPIELRPWVERYLNDLYRQ